MVDIGCQPSALLERSSEKGPNTFCHQTIMRLALCAKIRLGADAGLMETFFSNKQPIRDCAISALNALIYSNSKEGSSRSSFRTAQRTSLNSHFSIHSGDGGAGTSPVPFPNGLHGNHAGLPIPAEETDMKTWRKPKTAEIRVGTEINAYACAGL
ncbi:pyrroloquinoline quinone precursor peptide PqqA [Azospirillum sp. B21]|nr:pyrroloquinoline quinone precursor peptide PqqA [Azospirillum sp. B21]